MTNNDIFQKISSLPCHFTWSQLRNAGRTEDMNIENLKEHIEQTIKGTEVESYNLMGFYKTRKKSFGEARECFNKALENTKIDDEKIVVLGCLAWLTWEEKSSQEEITEAYNQVMSILRGRNAQGIPEVMAEKAFSIANSGYDEGNFQEALACVNRALEVKPGVMSKITKVHLMQQMHQARKKQVDPNDMTVNEIKHLWKEIIKTLADLSGMDIIHGQALIQYALFLEKTIKEDNVSSREEYAEKAKEVAHSSDAVMRNVAKFYMNSARRPLYSKNEVLSKLEKAEDILKTVAERKPAETNYKVFSTLGQVLLKKYEINPNEPTFDEAEKYLRKSWNYNRKYLITAIDLYHLYRRYYGKTKRMTALVEAEKIIFWEVASCSGEMDETNKAHFYSTYANFLMMFGNKLACYHKQTTSGTSENPGEMSELLKQYEEDRNDEKLLKAEQKFREMYGNLEKFRRPEQDRFHEEYGDFLEKYSRDLAFWYLQHSLDLNPHQRWYYTYSKLKELAQEKVARPDREEQRKGHEALKKMRRLQQN